MYSILFRAYEIPVSVHIIEPGFVKTEILNPDKMASSYDKGLYRLTLEEKKRADENRELGKNST